MPNDFFGEIRKLAQRLDPLIAQVEQWAKVDADETTKDSRAVLEQKRHELIKLFGKHVPSCETTSQEVPTTPQIAALQQEINAMEKEQNELYRSRGLTSKAVVSIVSDIRHVLELIPPGEARLQAIRAEMERLPFLKFELTDGFFTMGDACEELGVLKLRLDQFLLSRKPEEDRKRIVDELQGKLGCCDRYALAEKLNINDSAIRAAIRGDQGHSGPTAEAMILKACRNHGVDISLW